MRNRDIVITRGLILCRQLGKEHRVCVKFLYVALSPKARRRLKGTLTKKEQKLLEKFVAENYAEAEKDKSL